MLLCGVPGARVRDSAIWFALLRAGLFDDAKHTQATARSLIDRV